jgi:hypothetical protein
MEPSDRIAAKINLPENIDDKYVDVAAAAVFVVVWE